MTQHIPCSYRDPNLAPLCQAINHMDPEQDEHAQASETLRVDVSQKAEMATLEMLLSLKADRNCRLCVFTPRPEEPNATAADDVAAPAADASLAESGAADQT